MATIRVEFFGIPRQRAGLAETNLQADTLGQALDLLARQFPALGEACLLEGRLREGFLANINGQQFTRDPAAPLAEGDAVLILSADVGG